MTPDRLRLVPLLPFIVLLLSSCTPSSPRYINLDPLFAKGVFQRGEVTAQEVLDGAADTRLSPDFALPRFGDTTMRYWFKARLGPELLADGPTVIEIPYPLINRVNLWIRNGQDRGVHYHAGALYAFSERVIPTPDIAFPLPRSDHPLDIVIEIQTSSILLTPPLLWPRPAWEQHQNNLHLWYGFFIGGVIMLLLYNLFLASSLKDSSYLYYVLYLGSLSMLNLISAGYLDAYLLTDSAGSGSRIALSMVALSIVSIVLFINRFLDIKSSFPKWWQISKAMIFLSLPPVILGKMGPLSGLAITALLSLSHLSLWYALGLSLASWHTGKQQARFIVLAMSIIYFLMLNYQIFLLGFIDFDNRLFHLLELGSLAEGLILSLALADRIKLLREQVEQGEIAARKAQKNFSRRLIQAEEQERQRLSGLLHDSIAHGLLVLKQNLARFKRTGTVHTDEIQQQYRLCSELIDEVRHLSHDLHPHLLTRLGLRAATESILEKALTPAGIEWQADIRDIHPRLDPEREITLFRAIQESLSNILKHAHATEVMVSLNTVNGQVIVRVKDDGIGFDPATLDNPGLGLLTIRGRLELFGGSMNIHSSPGHGTQLSLLLPQPDVANDRNRQKQEDLDSNHR